MEDMGAMPAGADGGDNGHDDGDMALALLAACAAEPETDIGNSRRFRRRFGDLAEDYAGAASWLAIHVAHIGWHVFDGKRWKEDEDHSLIRPLAHETAEAIQYEPRLIAAEPWEEEILAAARVAAETLDRLEGEKPEGGHSDAQKKEMEDLKRAVKDAGRVEQSLRDRKQSRRRHAKSTAGSSKLNNMMQESAAYVARKVDQLNTDRYAVNCMSGTLRFVQVENPDSDPDDPTFDWQVKLSRHRPDDMITKLSRAEYDPDKPAKCPVFKEFLRTVIPDASVRLFLQRFFGYCLLGLTNEQMLLFFYGAGRNGKSTLMDLVCHILDDYAVTLDIASFAGENRRGGSEATPDLARLPGARLVAASEPESGVKLKDALIKHLTGGEKIPVRRLHQDFFEVDPHFKIIISGNHKPRIDDNSDGIWRRVKLVPFDVQIERDKVDRMLPQKLRGEATGVFAWMVEGALDYLRDGLTVPDAIELASQEYREESDPIGGFIRTCCLVTGDPADEETPLDLFMAYERLVAEEGFPAFKQSTFTRRLPDYAKRAWESPDGMMKQFAKSKRSTTIYTGIRLRPEWLPKRGEPKGPTNEERE